MKNYLWIAIGVLLLCATTISVMAGTPLFIDFDNPGYTTDVSVTAAGQPVYWWTMGLGEGEIVRAGEINGTKSLVSGKGSFAVLSMNLYVNSTISYLTKITANSTGHVYIMKAGTPYAFGWVNMSSGGGSIYNLDGWGTGGSGTLTVVGPGILENDHVYLTEILLTFGNTVKVSVYDTASNLIGTRSSTVGSDVIPTSISGLAFGNAGDPGTLVSHDDIRLSEAPEPPAPEPGLVAHYTFDEASGTTVNDSSVYGNTGTTSGGPVRVSVAGGKCLKFDGINDYVNCGNSSSLDIRNNLTVSYWVSPAERQNSQEPGIVGKEMNAFQTTYYQNSNVWSYIDGGGNNATAEVAPGVWTLVTMTFDGTYQRIYVNDRLVTKRTSLYSTINQGGNLFIGKGNTECFAGYIDEVKVYNRVLSDSEITARYTQTERDARNVMLLTDYSDVTGGQVITNGNLSIRAGSTGGIQITNGLSKFVLNSSYSYSGTSIGYNRLSQTNPGGGSGWSPVITKVDNSTLRITAAKISKYSLTRNIKFNNNRIEIEDTLTNLTTSVQGILIDHQMITPDLISNSKVGKGAECPLIFFDQPSGDWGVIGEDNIGRLQYHPTCTVNTAGIHHTNFGLDANASYKFKYAIYPLDHTGDVFTLVNRVRNDWGSNVKIEGPWGFLDVGPASVVWQDPDYLRQYLQKAAWNVVALMPWLDYDPQSMNHVMTRAEYKARMVDAAARIRAVCPNIKITGCIETDWITIDPNDTAMFPPPSGQTIIDNLDAMAVTAALENSNLPWKDSFKRINSNQTINTEIYSRGGALQYSAHVYPTSTNYQRSFLLGQAAFIMDTCGLDGFYIDEFSQSWVGGVRSYPKTGTNELQWDGNSVDIDPATGNVSLKYVDCGLAGISARVEIINSAYSRGKIATANSYSSSQSEQSLGINRFSEIEWYMDIDSLQSGYEPSDNGMMFLSVLGTPIGLGARTPSDPNADLAERLMLAMMQYLKHGMVYYPYRYPSLPETGFGSGEYGPINHMLPITPIELHKGWIKGQERIVSCVSYTTNWTNTSIYPHVHFFDVHGREIQAQPSTRFATITGPPGNRNISVTISDWSEFAIIETDNADNIAPTTIANTKSLLAGSKVYLKDIPVSAKIYNPDGSYYGFAVEEPDRFFGIRVINSTIINAGQKADIYGYTYLENGELVIDARNGAVFDTGSVTPIAPYSVATIDTGGASKSNQGAVLNSTTPLVASNALNNVGMLMRIRGKVTAVGADFFYVNDGYGVNALLDGSGYTGMKCGKANLASLPSVNDHVEVTGVVGVKKISTYNTRYLWTTSLTPATISTYAFYVHSGLTDFKNMISLPAQPVNPIPAELFSGIAINNNLQTYTGGTIAKTYTTATASTFGGINYSYGYSFDSSQSNPYVFSYLGYNDPTPLDRWISVPNGTSGGSVLLGVPYNHAAKWNDWHATDLTALKTVGDADTSTWLDTSGDWYLNGIASLLIPGDSLYQNYGYKIRVNKKLAIIAPANSTLNKTVTGSVLLEELSNEAIVQIGQIPIVIGTDNGTTNIFRAVVPTQITPNSGSFFIDVNSGIYNISLKASHWLIKLYADFNVDLNTNLGDAALINGDVVENNEIDFDDINAVRTAYGSFPGDGNWNERADVDGSGEVDFTDINIVRSNYGEIGD